MKHTVESKYKNPDRLIKVLKGQLDIAEAQQRDAHKRHGDYLFRYKRDVTHQFSVDDNDLGVCRTGDALIVVGRICHTEENCTSSEVTIDRITVRRCDHD